MKALPIVAGLALALSACTGTDRLPSSDRLPDVLEVVVRQSSPGFGVATPSEPPDSGGTDDAAKSLAQRLLDAAAATPEECLDEAWVLDPTEVKVHDALGTNKETTRFVVSFDGNVLSRPERDLIEGDPLAVVVVGPQFILPFVRVVQEEAGDPDIVRNFGAASSSFTAQEAGPTLAKPENDRSEQTACGARAVWLGDFEAGARAFTVQAFQGTENHNMAEVPFSVRRRYVGTLTFGGVYSSLEVPSYGLEPVNFDSTNAPVRIRETADERAHVVAGFAPVLFGPRTIAPGRFQPRLDGFVGVSVTDPLDNLFVGLTGNVNGLLTVQGGVHFGKVRAVREGAPFLTEELPSGAVIDDYLRDDWRRGWFIGASIDAASASAAFAKSIRELIDTR